MTNKSTRMLRPRAIYGAGGKLPVGRTTFYEQYVRRGGQTTVPGTSIPRLQLFAIGERARAAFESDVDDLLAAIRAERGLVLSGPISSTPLLATKYVPEKKRSTENSPGLLVARLQAALQQIGEPQLRAQLLAAID